MAGINIGLFDFDRHNALYYFIMNADEQIYMRYGGRDATSPVAYLNLNSLEIALKLGLEQHELYKQGKLENQKHSRPFFPRDIPLLLQNARRRRCVECHLIADYQTQELESAGRLNKIKDMYVSPDIKTIGIHLDIPKGLVVKEVNGAVKQAGMEANDLIVGINKEPVLTFGDLQYIFNKLPRNSKQIQISVEKNGKIRDFAVDLPKEWWWTDLYHRAWTVDPILFFSSRSLSEKEKRSYNFDVAGFACEVTSVYREAVIRGFLKLQPGDIIYAVDDVKVDKLTQNFSIYIKLNKIAGSSFTVKLLRDNKPMEMLIRTGRQSFRK